MPENRDTANGQAFPSGLAAAEAELRLRGSLDIAEITRLALDATVPEFADAAAVFLSDRLTRPQANDLGPVAARRLGSRLGHGNRPALQDALPAGEVIAFDPDSPYGRCMRDGQPVVFGTADRRALHHVHPEDRNLVSGYASFLAVPVTCGERTAGFSPSPGPPKPRPSARPTPRSRPGLGQPPGRACRAP